MHVLQDPPPLCDFEEWIGTKMKEKDKEHLRRMKEWEERKELLKKHKEEAAENERKEEAERRHAAQRREERKKKLERVRRAKASMEENPDALRKGCGLVTLSSLLDLVVAWFRNEQCYHVLDFSLSCHVLHFNY